MGRQRAYTDEDFIQAVANSRSWSQTLKTLGLAGCGGGSYKHMQKLAERLNADFSHFDGKGWNKGWQFDPRKTLTLEEICVENSTYTSTNGLRKRLLKEGIKQHKCEWCQRKTWNKLPIPLELDHINGINNDHRLENLRILCPNCHSQTPTWAGRNRGNYKP